MREAEHGIIAPAIAGVEQRKALCIDGVLDEFGEHADRKQPALRKIPLGRGVERVGDIGFEVRVAERHRPVECAVVVRFIGDLAAGGEVRIIGTPDAARIGEADNDLVIRFDPHDQARQPVGVAALRVHRDDVGLILELEPADRQVGAFDADARRHRDRPEIEVRHRIARRDIFAEVEVVQRRIGERRALVEHKIGRVRGVSGEGVDQAGVNHRRDQIVVPAAGMRNHVGALQAELAEREARRRIAPPRKDAVVRIEILVGRAIFPAELQPAVVAEAKLARDVEPASPDIFVAAFVLHRILAKAEAVGGQRSARHRAEQFVGEVEIDGPRVAAELPELVRLDHFIVRARDAIVEGPVVGLGRPADHADENGLLLILKPQVRSLLGHCRYAGQAIWVQCYGPIVPLCLRREIEAEALAIFILGEFAVEPARPLVGRVARPPVERGDAPDAFALELVIGIFDVGRQPAARRARKRRPIVGKDAEALEIALRIARADQDAELLVAAEAPADARIAAYRHLLVERLVTRLHIGREDERLGEVERGLSHEVDRAADTLRIENGGLRLGHLDAVEQLPRDDVERQTARVAVGVAELEAVDGIIVEVRRNTADRDIASLALIILHADAGQALDHFGDVAVGKLADLVRRGAAA